MNQLDLEQGSFDCVAVRFANGNFTQDDRAMCGRLWAQLAGLARLCLRWDTDEIVRPYVSRLDTYFRAVRR